MFNKVSKKISLVKKKWMGKNTSSKSRFKNVEVSFTLTKSARFLPKISGSGNKLRELNIFKLCFWIDNNTSNIGQWRMSFDDSGHLVVWNRLWNWKSVWLTHTIQATPLRCQYGSKDIDGARRKKLTILTSAMSVI